MKKLLLLAIVVLGISAVSFGQAGNTLTATTTASAKILSALTISAPSGPLHFGVMTKPQVDLTVHLSTEAARSVLDGKSASISLLNIAPSVNVPEYEVTGEPNATFKLVLPSSFNLSTSGMTVKNFVTNLTEEQVGNNVPNVNLGATGKIKFKIGADLEIPTSVESNKDVYTQNFEVSVAYE